MLSVSISIWDQTVCKGYQQTTKVATGMQRVKIMTKLFLLYEGLDGV